MSGADHLKQAIKRFAAPVSNGRMPEPGTPWDAWVEYRLKRLEDGQQWMLRVILAALLAQPRLSDPAVPLAAAALFIVFLAENSRLPVDDPNTHLELTMIHEVMILDHSGPLLGTALYAASMKLFVLGAFLLHVVAPFGTGIAWIDWPIFVAEMLALAAAIGVLESIIARLRMRRVPYLLVGSLMFCASAFILLVRL